LVREKRLNLYKDCLKFLKTRVELDLALFKDDIWSHKWKKIITQKLGKM
jgi:ribonuclease D